jgi:hypothetical protein
MRSLSIIAVIALTAPLCAETLDTRAAGSKITAVTVYQNSALVTRDVSVPEGAGTMELVISPLPPETIANSLYSEGSDGIRVLNTRFRSRAIKEDTREEVRKLEASLKQLAKTAQQLQADLTTASENLKFLSKMESFTAATLQQLSEKGLLNSEASISMAKFVMTTRTERGKGSAPRNRRRSAVSSATCASRHRCGSARSSLRSRRCGSTCCGIASAPARSKG